MLECVFGLTFGFSFDLFESCFLPNVTFLVPVRAKVYLRDTEYLLYYIRFRQRLFVGTNQLRGSHAAFHFTSSMNRLCVSQILVRYLCQFDCKFSTVSLNLKIRNLFTSVLNVNRVIQEIGLGQTLKKPSHLHAFVQRVLVGAVKQCITYRC